MRRWWLSLSRAKRRLAILGGIGAALALLTQVLNALHMVMAGRGTETYNSARLIQWNYIGQLTVFVALGLVLVAGALIRLYVAWRDRRQVTKPLSRESK